MNIHPFVQFVFVVWLFAAIATWRTKESSPFGFAFCATVLVGVGYLILRGG